MFGQIYEFSEDHTLSHITFTKWSRVVLVHKDTKYEHEFVSAWTRGVIRFPHNIFDKLVLVDDFSEYFISVLQK